jgi:hypothetical protein
MAYELMIWREDNISTDEWVDAISAVKNVKIDSSKTVAKNPNTGAVIEIEGKSTDASIKYSKGRFFWQKETWVHSFRFSSKFGFAKFPYSEELDLPDNQLRIVASQLAKILNAKIIGEGDELYDW